MQDNKLTEKLQQLDNQQLPDLSQMDKHWKQMQASLGPAKTTTGKGFPKAGLWIIVAVCIIGLVFLLTQPSKKQTVTETKNSIANTNVLLQSIITDTPAVQKTIAVVKKVVIVKKENKIVSKNDLVKNNNNPPLSTIQQADPITDHLPKTGMFGNAINKKQLLLETLEQLKKPGNLFLINNSKDTLLNCVEGTSLLIPANSLGGGNVTLAVTEFYKKSEMVLNKLSTTSNGNLLESAGMIHIEATKDGKPVQQSLKTPIRFYPPGNNIKMERMQLFTAKEKIPAVKNTHGNDTAASSVLIDGINWNAEPQYFRTTNTLTEVKVLDIRNEPFKTIKRKKGIVAVFNLATKPEMPKSVLKKMLKEKYGYSKIRFGFRENSFFHGRLSSMIDSITYSDKPIGDSAWISKKDADKYGLPYTDTRTFYFNDETNSNKTTARYLTANNNKLLEKIKDRYSVDINSLGWINCDRFNNDPRQKLNYVVDLGDSAADYYTVLVFDKIKSVVTGVTAGNLVMFTNMPLGEPVKIISIGIDKNGRIIMSMRSANIEKNTLTGFYFENSSPSDIKSSLSIMDK